MESKADRREAARKFREQKPDVGAFAVRCAVTNSVWVGAARNLSAFRNQYWFTLRAGGHYDKSLQAEWTAHGEPAFSWEVLETLDPELHPLAVIDALKAAKATWAERLGARSLVG